MKFFSGKVFFVTLIMLIVVFLGITYFQNFKPLEKSSPEKTTAPAEHTDIEVKSTAETVVEKQDVHITFVYNNEELETKVAQLYEVTKQNDSPVKIVADGDIAKSLIKELNIPQNTSLKQAAILKSKNKRELDRIISGDPIIGINKDKTLVALEESIKTSLGSHTLSVNVYTEVKDERGGALKIMQDLGFKTQIASFSTLHEGHIDDENRNVNLEIAAKKIDGIIIKPGEHFSFNKVVGSRTKANGFKDAGVIQSGRVIPGIGGGICQVSTTLYRAVLMSGVKIKERHNHSIYDGIEYADRGLDAAVAWGYKDFKFVNSLKTPILIYAKGGKGAVSIEIYAESQPFEKIVLETRNEVKHAFKTEKTVNASLPPGKIKVLHPGVDGYSIEAFRIITENGITKQERLSKDRYLTFNRREEVGR
ncbi:MAG: VanW family protein [Candidatus Riflebacteria bacterium]|nr:VanW family protein [Candidatus Riflebacteria bacterium]